MRLRSKTLFNAFLFVPVFYGFNSWAAPLTGLAAPYSPAKAVSNLTISPGLRILHQGMVSHVEISLDYGTKAGGLNSDILIREAAQLLVDYPAKYDYWEIVNLSITQSLLAAYPQLEYVTLQLDISPSDRVHYRRASTVTRWAHGAVSESWRFEMQELSIQGRPLSVAINYSYTDAAIYPDYLDVSQQLMTYLSGASAKSMPLEKLERALAQHLLHYYAGAIAEISVQLE